MPVSPYDQLYKYINILIAKSKTRQIVWQAHDFVSIKLKQLRKIKRRQIFAHVIRNISDIGENSCAPNYENTANLNSLSCPFTAKKVQHTVQIIIFCDGD